MWDGDGTFRRLLVLSGYSGVCSYMVVMLSIALACVNEIYQMASVDRETGATIHGVFMVLVWLCLGFSVDNNGRKGFHREFREPSHFIQKKTNEDCEEEPMGIVDMVGMKWMSMQLRHEANSQVLRRLSGCSFKSSNTGKFDKHKRRTGKFNTARRRDNPQVLADDNNEGAEEEPGPTEDEHQPPAASGNLAENPISSGRTKRVRLTEEHISSSAGYGVFERNRAGTTWSRTAKIVCALTFGAIAHSVVYELVGELGTSDELDPLRVAFMFGELIAIGAFTSVLSQIIFLLG